MSRAKGTSRAVDPTPVVVDVYVDYGDHSYKYYKDADKTEMYPDDGSVDVENPLATIQYHASPSQSASPIEFQQVRVSMVAVLGEEKTWSNHGMTLQVEADQISITEDNPSQAPSTYQVWFEAKVNGEYRESDPKLINYPGTGPTA